MKTKAELHPHIKALCFDFDGTIADTMPFLAEIAVEIMCTYYTVDEDFARKRYIETTGLPFEQQVASIFPDHPNNPGAVKEFEARKRANYLRLPPVKGIETVLRVLREKGYRVAISSSTLQQLVNEYVQTYHLSCDLALGYRPNFRKGYEHFEAIMKAFQVEHGQVCYIGDSLNDYRVAAMNGIGFVAKLGLFRADAFSHLDQKMIMISNMEELLAIF